MCQAIKDKNETHSIFRRIFFCSRSVFLKRVALITFFDKFLTEHSCLTYVNLFFSKKFYLVFFLRDYDCIRAMRFKYYSSFGREIKIRTLFFKTGFGTYSLLKNDLIIFSLVRYSHFIRFFYCIFCACRLVLGAQASYRFSCLP